MHVKFFQYLCIQFIYQQKKTDTLNTIKLKIGLSYYFQGTNPKNLTVLGTMYFEMGL